MDQFFYRHDDEEEKKRLFKTNIANTFLYQANLSHFERCLVSVADQIHEELNRDPKPDVKAQLERIKSLHAETSAPPKRGALKTTSMGGPGLFAVSEEPKSIGIAVLNSFKTEELIQELANRGLDVLVKKPARKPKYVSF